MERFGLPLGTMGKALYQGSAPLGRWWVAFRFLRTGHMNWFRI